MRQSEFFEWKTVSDAQVQTMFNPKFAARISRLEYSSKMAEKTKIYLAL
ncbi:MAG: hypothetical protein WKF71_09790 [Pyrinomonadaceae bacterium]